MKTSAPATTRPSTASGARLRRLAVVGLVAPVVALAACSGESPVTADPTAPAGTTPAATSTSTTSTTTAAPTTAAPTTAAPVKYSTRTVKAVIKDPQLGHTITAMRVSRGLPFPKNQPVGAEAFEIVGVKVEFAAGSRYSASLDPKMLTLIATNPKQNVAPTAEFGKAYKADPLLTTKRDERDRGWVFFKVDRGTTTALRLAFNRPAYAVSTTDKNIPAKTFSVVLTK
ncbi:hypothetical protein [Terrabacter sp. Soil811]|uniref:hypothetical protein n=1 Tax=Terrabacter sp. Soil811 TaxID=1736419 RepID=UPI0012E3B17D|nr:hypothetical protein [Terrabacter sp. Soil811]